MTATEHTEYGPIEYDTDADGHEIGFRQVFEYMDGECVDRFVTIVEREPVHQA